MNHSEALTRAGERRRKAADAEAKALDDIREAARKAHADGVPVTRIAELAGVSRVTVYAMLDD